MLNLVIFLVLLGITGWLIVKQASRAVWAISYGLIALLLVNYNLLGSVTQIMVIGIFVSFVVACTPMRRLLISRFILPVVAKAMPVMSNTEREALEAGTVSWEGDLFTGAPDFSVLLGAPTTVLRDDEQAFLDGPVNTLCRMIDDWDITHNRTDLPPEIWAFIKEQGFLGMIIPKAYGGLEFSATAQMSILVKLYGRSISVATTVSVPNSLGPMPALMQLLFLIKGLFVDKRLMGKTF